MNNMFLGKPNQKIVNFIKSNSSQPITGGVWKITWSDLDNGIYPEWLKSGTRILHTQSDDSWDYQESNPYRSDFFQILLYDNIFEEPFTGRTCEIRYGKYGFDLNVFSINSQVALSEKHFTMTKIDGGVLHDFNATFDWYPSEEDIPS